MKSILKYWKVFLAVALLIVAYMVYNTYQTEKAAYELQVKQTETMITSLQNAITKNKLYEDVQDDLDAAREEVNASRLELYRHFPVEMKEEDQIMYVLYLESIFGTEISFSFATPQALLSMRDGSTLMGLTLTVNYMTTYQGFQDMVTYLATDSRITSVQYADIAYDVNSDTAVGTITLLLYLMDSDLLDYVSPDVAIPDTGKDNIFG